MLTKIRSFIHRKTDPNRKTRILFILYDFGSGGAQKVLADLANNLDPERFDVTIHTLMGGGAFFSKLSPHIHTKSVIHAKNRIVRKLLSGVFQYLIPPAIQYRLFYHNGYDYEVAFMEGYPTKLLAASRHKRKYAWVHIDVGHYNDHDRLFRSFQDQKKAYRTFREIFCVSDIVRDSFIKKFGITNRVHILKNIFDDEEIRREAGERNPYPDASCLHLTAVGNLIPRKRMERLIDVADILRARNPEMKFMFHIIGDGPERERLQEEIRERHLEDRVVLEGFQGNPYPYIGHADVLVCASEVEGYSTVVAEALILGVPVLVTESSGMRKLLGKSECGVIVSQEDAVYEMTEALVLTDWDAMRPAAKKRGECFSVKRSIQKIETIFTI